MWWVQILHKVHKDTYRVHKDTYKVHKDTYKVHRDRYRQTRERGVASAEGAAFVPLCIDL